MWNYSPCHLCHLTASVLFVDEDLGLIYWLHSCLWSNVLQSLDHLPSDPTAQERDQGGPLHFFFFCIDSEIIDSETSDRFYDKIKL